MSRKNNGQTPVIPFPHGDPLFASAFVTGRYRYISEAPLPDPDPPFGRDTPKWHEISGPKPAIKVRAHAG